MTWIWLSNIATAQAEEHGAGAAGVHELTIPWTSIFVQGFNLVLLLGLLVFLLRKTVKQHFAERAESYRQLVDRAEKAKREAERAHTQVKDKLAKLEAGAAQDVAHANQEAAE